MPQTRSKSGKVHRISTRNCRVSLKGEILWRSIAPSLLQPQLGLNKGESLHSLAKKLFFGQQGEIRDRLYQEQLNTASSLNLLLAGIVVWNTVHLQACLRRLHVDGRPVDDNDLRFLSPLMYKHIGFYGQYNFDIRHLETAPSPETFIY